MAEQTKVHGDLKQVANFDAREYTVGSLSDVTDAVTVQPQGPKLDFFTVTFSGAVSGATVKAAIDGIQQLATVYLYRYNANGGSADSLAVAVYPTGAYTTTTIATAAGGASATATATFG
jgi:hypothetical protein